MQRADPGICRINESSAAAAGCVHLASHALQAAAALTSPSRVSWGGGSWELEGVPYLSAF